MAVKLRLAGHLEAFVPILIVMGRKVAGVQDVQQQLGRYLGGEVGDFGGKPFPGGHMQHAVRHRPQGILPQTGEQDGGHPVLVQNLHAFHNALGGAGVGNHDGAVFLCGGKQQEQQFPLVGFHQHVFAQPLHLALKKNGAVQRYADPHQIDITGGQQQRYRLFQRVVVQQGQGVLDALLVPTIVGGIQPFLVFFGMHLAIFPPLQTIQLAEMGYETVCGPGFLAAVLACSGAAIGFGLRTRDKNAKELAFSTGFTAFCGVTEPAVYGIIVKYKKIIPAVVLGGVCGGLFAGIFHLKRYAIASPGVPALPTFIGEDPNNIFVAIGTVCIAFVISLVAAYLLSGDKKKSAQPAAPQDADLHPTDTAAAHTLYAPLTGTVIPLEEVPDETFSAGILGQGLAIRPDDPTVYAPFDGTVIQTVDSKHAVGLRSADGMEVLIHVGIDTVDMNGQGFTLYCKEGDTVRRGQRLLTFDPKAIEAAGHPTVTVVIVTNSDDYQAVTPLKIGPAAAMDPVLTVEG